MRHSLVVLLFAAYSALAQPFQALVSSPNRALSISFLTVSNDQPEQSRQLVYTVSFQGRPLLDRSALRLELKDQPPLGSNVRLVNSTTSQADRTYRLMTGKTSTARDHYNGLRLELEEHGEPPRKLML